MVHLSCDRENARAAIDRRRTDRAAQADELQKMREHHRVDVAGRTLVSASSVEKGTEKAGANVETATKIGKLIAERAQGAKVSQVVFDRGGFIFHGKVKALADAAREGGLQF